MVAVTLAGVPMAAFPVGTPVMVTTMNSLPSTRASCTAVSVIGTDTVFAGSVTTVGLVVMAVPPTDAV
jgi:hypothetical protein